MFRPADNKYTRWYFALVQKRQASPLPKSNEYCEEHHIHPQCLGGSNKKENKVLFSAREHFVAHLLLTKMPDGDAKRKMHYAFYSMRRGKRGMDRYSPNSHIYSILTKNIKREPTAETRAKMSASQKNRPPITDVTRKNLSKAVKASYTPELRALRSTSQKDRLMSDEHRDHLSVSAKARWARGVPESHREAARQRRGAASGRSKTWSLQDPKGKLHLTSACNDFCIEHGLSYYGLRNKAVANDTTPIVKGPSKGWSVLSCTEKI